MYLGSLFILYIVIETAVRRGINNTIIGQALEQKLGISEEKKKSFFSMIWTLINNRLSESKQEKSIRFLLLISY